jgi:hypothetical protein
LYVRAAGDEVYYFPRLKCSFLNLHEIKMQLVSVRMEIKRMGKD